MNKKSPSVKKLSVIFYFVGLVVQCLVDDDGCMRMLQRESDVQEALDMALIVTLLNQFLEDITFRACIAFINSSHTF